MTKKRIHFLYGIVLGAVAVIAGICLIAACVGIYRSGDHPFSRESVAAAFKTIAVPVYALLALVIGGFILDIFLPREKTKPAAEKQYGAILERLHRKLDLNCCESSMRISIEKQRKSRRLHGYITLGLLIVCSAVFLSYGANMQNFHKEDMNGSMIKAMYLFTPCLLIPFGYGVFTAYFSRRSIKKEIELVKQAIAAGNPAPQVQTTAKEQSTKPAVIAKYAILAVSLAVLIYGFFAGGTADVLAKAAAICTECVGLG